MIRNPTPKSFRDFVRERVNAAGTTREKAGEAIGISRSATYEWVASGDLSISQLAKLAKGSGEAIVIRFDPNPDDIDKRAPRPLWAEELAEEVKSDLRAEIRKTQEVVVGTVSRQAASATGKALEQHLQQLLDVLSRVDARLRE